MRNLFFWTIHRSPFTSGPNGCRILRIADKKCFGFISPFIQLNISVHWKINEKIIEWGDVAVAFLNTTVKPIGSEPNRPNRQLFGWPATYHLLHAGKRFLLTIFLPHKASPCLNSFYSRSQWKVLGGRSSVHPSTGTPCSSMVGRRLTRRSVGLSSRIVRWLSRQTSRWRWGTCK